MTTLLWQTALLLLGAYFLGAWVACIVRRVIHVSSAETLPSVGLQTVPAAVVPASPPPRLADLEPIKPKIEPVGKSASAPQADAAAPRATIASRPAPVA